MILPDVINCQHYLSKLVVSSVTNSLIFMCHVWLLLGSLLQENLGFKQKTNKYTTLYFTLFCYILLLYNLFLSLHIKLTKIFSNSPEPENVDYKIVKV